MAESADDKSPPPTQSAPDPRPVPPADQFPDPQSPTSGGIWPQYSLKWLLAVMTGVCLLISAAIQFQTAAVLLMPLGLCVLLLVRDRWALLVVSLYGLILLAMSAPLAAAAFQHLSWEILGMYTVWQFWLWFDMMILSQAALLVIPVAKQQRRPVRRRSLWTTTLAGGLMMGLLVLSAGVSLHEFVTREPLQDAAMLGALLAGLAVWAGWAVVFYLYGRRREPVGMVAQMCRLLLAGSILELLIAIPTHIVARSRDYCCAGFMTFLGLVFGFSVMLFSFGPGLYFLFVARWRQVRPEKP